MGMGEKSVLIEPPGQVLQDQFKGGAAQQLLAPSLMLATDWKIAGDRGWTRVLSQVRRGRKSPFWKMCHKGEESDRLGGRFFFKMEQI